MPSIDPVGDMIAMIKNANTRKLRRVSLPHSRLKEGVAQALKREGYVEDVKAVTEEGRKFLHVYLKYDVDNRQVITDIVRISRPGRRVFRPVTKFGKVLDGLGIQVLSTSKGILSDREARRQRVGGEMICKVW
jgi:small subunit ribosomal protein S8